MTSRPWTTRCWPIYWTPTRRWRRGESLDSWGCPRRTTRSERTAFPATSTCSGGWAIAGSRLSPNPRTMAPHRLGRFEIRDTLGQGGFGIVYLAHDPTLGRQVALKVPRPEVLMNPEVRRRFLREARAAAGLDHPNIVPVHEAGEAGPLCYIASAYCPGPTLSAWLRAQAEPVRPDSAARLVASLCDAVQHAHDRGILHRDIKPSNVILSGTEALAAARGRQESSCHASPTSGWRRSPRRPARRRGPGCRWARPPTWRPSRRRAGTATSGRRPTSTRWEPPSTRSSPGGRRSGARPRPRRSGWSSRPTAYPRVSCARACLATWRRSA